MNPASLKQRPSLDADSRHGTPRSLWNPKVHCSLHKTLQLITIQGHLIRPAPTTYLFKTNLKILMPMSRSFFVQVFKNKQLRKVRVYYL